MYPARVPEGRIGGVLLGQALGDRLPRLIEVLRMRVPSPGAVVSGPPSLSAPGCQGLR